MTETALQASEDGARAKAVRIPSLPGRQPGAVQVDVESDVYKTGYAAAAADLRGELAEQEARHDAFTQSIGEALTEMDVRYRNECLSLIERLFSAVAPALAVKSSLTDIMQIVDERAQRDHSELTLRTHPSLIEHLSEKDQRILSNMPLVTLKSDDSCAPAMVDAQWKKGGLYHDPDGLIEEILQVLREETAPQEESGND